MKALFKASFLLTLLLVGCAPSKESPTQESAKLETQVQIPVRAVPNLGATCYFGAALHFFRGLESERAPIQAQSSHHQQVLDRYSDLMKAFPASSPAHEPQVMGQAIVEAFRSDWNEYINQDEYKETLKPDFIPILRDRGSYQLDNFVEVLGSIPVSPRKDDLSALTEEYKTLLENFVGSTEEIKKLQKIEDALVQKFGIDWEDYIKKDEFRDFSLSKIEKDLISNAVNNCKIKEMGWTSAIFDCLAHSLGYERPTTVTQNEKGSYYIFGRDHLGAHKRGFVSVPFKTKGLSINQRMKIGDRDYRIIGCAGISGHHASALMLDGPEEHLFHYDDSSITWIPNKADGKCHEEGTELLLERI